MSTKAIIQRFNESASHYDKFATMQAKVAQHLVEWAIPPIALENILDVGSGTGFVLEAIKKRWPHAVLTALDSAPNMLAQGQKKIPNLKIITADAAQINIAERYDAIFSSMALHWLPDARKALQNWQNLLRPEGRAYIALLVEGSFEEWRKLCASEGIKGGLWPMPNAGFAKDLASRTEQHAVSLAYPSAKEFLYTLKSTGASAPRSGHNPISIPAMRRLLHRAPKPFTVSYQVLYIELPSSPNI